MSWYYCPKEFSSYEEYVKYLKEMGLAFDAPEGQHISDNVCKRFEKRDGGTTMTREEQIKQAAYIRYVIGSSPTFVYYESCSDEDIAKSRGFIDGAKWADQHPSVDTVKKIICYALRLTNIMPVEDLEKGVNWELLIKKSMEE